MTPKERQDKIMEILTQKLEVNVLKLATLFNVTDETIRRDLKVLEEEKKVIRSYGGAKLFTTRKCEVPIAVRQDIFKESKLKISEICSNYINDNDVIFIDASTTAYYIIPHLLKKKNITIVSNSLLHLGYASSFKKLKIICLGGTLDPLSNSFLGSQTILQVKNIFFDKAFISCRGMNKLAITDANDQQALLRKIVLQHTNYQYLILDQTKFDVTSLHVIEETKNLSHIITDKKPSNFWCKYFKKNQIICDY